VDPVAARLISVYFIHGLLQSENGIIGRFCGTQEMDRLIEKGVFAIFHQE